MLSRYYQPEKRAKRSAPFMRSHAKTISKHIHAGTGYRNSTLLEFFSVECMPRYGEYLISTSNAALGYATSFNNGK